MNDVADGSAAKRRSWSTAGWLRGCGVIVLIQRYMFLIMRSAKKVYFPLVFAALACNAAPRTPAARAPADEPQAACPDSSRSVPAPAPVPEQTEQLSDNWWAARAREPWAHCPGIGRIEKTILSVRCHPHELVFVDALNVVRIRPAELMHAEPGRWEWRLAFGPPELRCVLQQDSPSHGTFQCSEGDRLEMLVVERIEDRSQSNELDRLTREARQNPHEPPTHGPATYSVDAVRVHFFLHADGIAAVRGTLDSEDAVQGGGHNAFVYTDAAFILVDLSGPDFTTANGTLSVVATMSGKVRLNKSVSLRNYFGESHAITVPFLVYGNGDWCSSLQVSATLTVKGKASSRKVDVPLVCGE